MAQTQGLVQRLTVAPGSALIFPAARSRRLIPGSNPRKVADVVETIARIGALTGATERARELSDKLQKRLAEIDAGVQAVQRPRVLIILSTEPLITAGGSTFVNDLIERAGGRSISANESAEYPQYSLETAVATRPEVIFLQAQDARLPERLKETPAARTGRVYHIDDNLMLRPGPRIIDGLEQVAAEIHPEIFKPGSRRIVQQDDDRHNDNADDTRRHRCPRAADR